MDVISKFSRSTFNLLFYNLLRLETAFHDLDPRLFLLCEVGDDIIGPCKICGGLQIRVPKSIHSFNQRCPKQGRLQSVLGVRGSHFLYNMPTSDSFTTFLKAEYCVASVLKQPSMFMEMT